MMEFTKEQKESALKAFGWEKLVGFAMEYGAPESDNIFISLEEMRKYVGKQAEEYWVPEGDCEYIRDLEDAWECMYDELYNVLDIEDEKKIDEHILKKIKQ